MLVNPNIFKSYDIRGIFKEEFDEDFAYSLGRIFTNYVKSKKIAVAHDARLSSPILYSSLLKGIVDAGADVIALGMVPTECLYFASKKYNCPGIMITASHNPKNYNGFKMITVNGEISYITGKEIKRLFEERLPEKKEKGEIIEKNIKEDYLNHIFSFFSPEKIKKMKIVVDIGNGAAGEVIKMASERTPIELIPLNFNPDGNFPSRGPNPLSEGAGKLISEKIKAEKADAGFSFDGDGDRVFLFTDKGEFVSADITLILIAKALLLKYPGSAISYNAICSKAVPHFVSKWKGVPIRTKVGFVNVRDAIMKKEGSMGGEISGHYCFKDNYYMDSGTMAYIILLQLLSDKESSLSDRLKEITLYFKSSEVNFKVSDKEELLKKVEEKYSDGKQDFLDGITVSYNSWWFNVRASQTEPLLRLTIEAEEKELFERKKEELINFIEENK